jgi:hypothetical protein
MLFMRQSPYFCQNTTRKDWKVLKHFKLTLG